MCVVLDQCTPQLFSFIPLPVNVLDTQNRLQCFGARQASCCNKVLRHCWVLKNLSLVNSYTAFMSLACHRALWTIGIVTQRETSADIRMP